MVGIHIDQFAILASSFPTRAFDMNFGLGFKVAEDQKMFGCTCEIDYSAGEDRIITLKITCDFLIRPDDWNSQIANDGNILLTKELQSFLALHTVGTARGIMFCKTEGTPFNSLIVPPVNLDKVIREDIQFAPDRM